MSRDPEVTSDLAPTSAPAPRAAAGEISRLDPGVTLADRYRIVSQLGKGGMGEVYRADDLELNVRVALKFLPPHLAADPVRLDHLRAEVRTARQVSHPNVCRVFDIAQSEGRSFITMEYVDGEDLSSLLARIGRLPPDKAVQIARQICFGLAAAHEQGLVHRDLKPANIMIDGRGNARIMDFGIAGLAAELNATGDVSAGTPIYMAPEQLEAREVTARSDIYALGHVLYEIFTGKPVFNRDQTRTLDDIKSLHRSGTAVTRPSEHVDLDPAVERVILHCLEHDPAARPQSAIAVAAALPGGDPLAAAIAAGETPSPELVALSGTGAGLSRRLAWGLVALVVIAIAWLGGINNRFAIHRRVPFALPPDVLASRARDLVRAFTGEAPPAQEAWSLSYDASYINRLTKSADPERWSRIADADPAVIRFWYRAAPDTLTPTGWWEKTITANSPPRTGDSVYISLDTAGRLLRFDRSTDEGFRTPADGHAPPVPSPAADPEAIDWSPFFKAAELEQSAYIAAAPRLPPAMPADHRFAWTGPTPRDIQPLLISAASLDGVPVHFERRPDLPPAGADLPSTVDSVIGTIASVMLLLGVAVAVYFARTNIRARRGDRAGAWRIALFTFTVELLAMTLGRNSLADIFASENFGRPLARALWIAVLAWVFYMALEPLVRRAWPQLLISWSRLLSGSWRDPLVACHTLLGLGAGGLTSAVFASIASLRLAPGGFTSAYLLPHLGHHVGMRFSLSATLTSAAATVALGLILTLLLIGLKVLFKRPWIITPILAVCFGVLFFGPGNGGWPLIATALACGSVLAVLLVREGVLALTVGLLSASVFVNFPFTLDLNAWYASTALAYAAAAIALAVFAAINATRPSARVP